MEIIARNEKLCIRKMQETEQDLKQHLVWMTDPDTMRYWDGMTVHYTYGMILEMYRDHQKEGVTPCFIELAGRPIGYVQFDCIPHAEGYECPEEEWNRFVRPGETVYGIDMFIGEVSCRDRGIGTEMLRLLSGALFEKYGADVLVVDPKTHNTRAIACYRKCGFEDCFTVPKREEQDGVWYDSLIMCLRKSETGAEK